MLLLDVGEAQEKQYSASSHGPRWVGKAPQGLGGQFSTGRAHPGNVSGTRGGV